MFRDRVSHIAFSENQTYHMYTINLSVTTPIPRTSATAIGSEVIHIIDSIIETSEPAWSLFPGKHVPRLREHPGGGRCDPH